MVISRLKPEPLMSHQTVPSDEKTQQQKFPEEVVMASSASDGLPVLHKRLVRMSDDVAYYKCNADGKSVRTTINGCGEVQETPPPPPRRGS